MAKRYLINQLTEKFNSTTNVYKYKIYNLILTTLPKSWALKQIETKFGVTNFIARKAKSLVKEKGVMSFPDPQLDWMPPDASTRLPKWAKHWLRIFCNQRFFQNSQQQVAWLWPSSFQNRLQNGHFENDCKDIRKIAIEVQPYQIHFVSPSSLTGHSFKDASTRLPKCLEVKKWMSGLKADVIKRDFTELFSSTGVYELCNNFKRNVTRLTIFSFKIQSWSSNHQVQKDTRVSFFCCHTETQLLNNGFQ